MNISEMTREQAFEAWIAEQMTNPPKAVGRLETMGGNCCLGNACRVFVPKTRKQSKIHNTITYEQENYHLPQTIREKLNIRSSGEFNHEGARITRIWARENQIKPLWTHKLAFLDSLTGANDCTDADHFAIGLLIRALYENNGFLPYI